MLGQGQRGMKNIPSASLKVARGVMSRISGRTSRVISALGRARAGTRRVVRTVAVNFILAVGWILKAGLGASSLVSRVGDLADGVLEVEMRREERLSYTFCDSSKVGS